MPVNWDADRIVVRGRLTRFDELRRICAGLFDRIEQRGYADVTLDFAGCDAATEAAVLPLLPILVDYRETQGVRFELVEPERDELRRLFLNANWAHFINPERYALRGQFTEQVPAQRFVAAGEMDSIVNEVMHLLFARMSIERETLAALE